MVTGLIEEAARKGGGDFDLIQRDTLKGEKLLWLAVDETAIWAAAVVGLHVEKDRKTCCIWACGGRERERWLPLLSELEKFAKAEGCESICLYGRKGWAREFPEYKLVQIKLEKRL
jgi:hypothetical protein